MAISQLTKRDANNLEAQFHQKKTCFYILFLYDLQLPKDGSGYISIGLLRCSSSTRTTCLALAEAVLKILQADRLTWWPLKQIYSDQAK